MSRNENKASKRQRNVNEPEWEYNSTDVFHKPRYMIELMYGGKKSVTREKGMHACSTNMIHRPGSGRVKGAWTPNQRQKPQRYVQHEDRN